MKPSTACISNSQFYIFYFKRFDEEKKEYTSTTVRVWYQFKLNILPFQYFVHIFQSLFYILA